MFKIGDFSKLTCVSIRMLRYYDEIDLLKPAWVDLSTGYRFYSAKQIPILNKIIGLRDVGFLVAEIASILSDDSNYVTMLDRLEQRKAKIADVIINENEKLKKIEKMINCIDKEEEAMNYEVVIKSIPVCRVISLRDTITSYNNEYLLWEKLGQFIKKNKIKCDAMWFAIYHDRVYREADIDVEVAVAVFDLQDDREGFTFRETEPVIAMAVMMIPGPFVNLPPAYNYLAGWIEENNYEISGSFRQICHKGPWNEEEQDNYLTEIQIPVIKK